VNVGDVFGRLTVLELVPGHRPSIGLSPRARVVCECGEERVVDRGHLRTGHTRSCGCLNREVVAGLFRTHGHASGGALTPEYLAWENAKDRTTNPNDPAWRHYGGRGITMADEWLHDFAAFFAHIGPKPDPSLTLDRIDNDRGYEPGNVRWATRVQQRANRRDSRAAA